MACYPCTHCNKCGMYNVQAVTVCADCRTQIGPGILTCPTCGGKKFTTAVLTPGEAAPSKQGEAQ